MNRTHTALINCLAQSGRPMSVVELISAGGMSRVSVQKELKKLVVEGRVERRGEPPRVYYSLAAAHVLPSTNTSVLGITGEAANYLATHFTTITPSGTELSGVSGFAQWCRDRNITGIAEEAQKYIAMHIKYEHMTVNGVIDATVKLHATFGSDVNLRKLYFLHPYSIPVYGKTRIGEWLFIGKQTQNRELMGRVLAEVVPVLRDMITRGGYDAVAFVPPTIPRTVQFIDMLRKSLSVSREIPILKITRDIRIPQKSLKNLSDRISNAESTFVVPVNGSNVASMLIIDDFTGSGSTLNVLAGIMRRQGVADAVDGLTITGSMNGFEVIKEV
jgi:DNA-binding transcriptional ArsR family regulator